MEENNLENKGFVSEVGSTPPLENKPQMNNTAQIAGAIIVAGIIIGGAILLRGSMPPPSDDVKVDGTGTATTLKKVTTEDKILGDPRAKVAIVLYEDYQCPFCGKFFTETEVALRDTYVKNGQVQIVYRDFAFLGGFVQPYVEANDESLNSAEAARCAGDQDKFWEYHDYLYNHQNGENKGSFSLAHLKEFATAIGLDRTSFDQCLDGNKYLQAIKDSKIEASNAGVSGTPKGYILKSGKVVDTIDGAIPLSLVKQKLDAVLK